MRIVLTNFGSTGSVYPFLALAVTLQRRGHDALVALPPCFAETAKSLGVAFQPIGIDLRVLQNGVNQSMVHLRDSKQEYKRILAPLFTNLPGMYEDLLGSCSRADILVSGPVQPASLMLHETLGIPLVTIQNVHYSSGGSRAFKEGLAELINPIRANFGLRPLDDPIMQANRAQLVLFAMSRYVRPRLHDWPQNHHMTGYFFLDEPWHPDQELEEFLASGDPPVVFTFGSMTHSDPARLTHLMLSAITQIGCRAVIQHGWSGLAHINLPQGIKAVGFVPHSWLFDRASVVVHHGGSGTTAAVFRAGIPSVFVPHTWDQPVWAELARGLGCAGEMLPLSDLDSEQLAVTIRKMISNPSYRTSAANLGRLIRSEPGVRGAAEFVEALGRDIGVLN